MRRLFSSRWQPRVPVTVPVLGRTKSQERTLPQTTRPTRRMNRRAQRHARRSVGLECEPDRPPRRRTWRRWQKRAQNTRPPPRAMHEVGAPLGGKAKAGTGGPSFEGALGRSGGRGRARGRAFNAGRGGGDRGQSALSSGGPCGVRQEGKREHPGVEFALVRLSSPLSSLSLFLLSLSHPLSRLVDMSLVNDKQRTKEAEKGEFSHSSPTHSHDGAMAPAPSKKGGFQGATMPEGTTCVVCSSKESSSLSPVAWC